MSNERKEGPSKWAVVREQMEKAGVEPSTIQIAEARATLTLSKQELELLNGALSLLVEEHVDDSPTALRLLAKIRRELQDNWAD